MVYRAKIEGADALVRALVKAGMDVGQALEAATQAGANLIQQAANGYAPEPLIATEVVKRKPLRVEIEIGPPDDKWQWRFVESGTQPHEIPGPITVWYEGRVHLVGGAQHPGGAAQPFLRPAFDAQRKPAVTALGERIKRELPT